MNRSSESHNNGVDMREEGRTEDSSGAQPAGPRLRSPFIFPSFLFSLEPGFCHCHVTETDTWTSHRFLKLNMVKTELHTACHQFASLAALVLVKCLPSTLLPDQKDSFLAEPPTPISNHLFSTICIDLQAHYE